MRLRRILKRFPPQTFQAGTKSRDGEWPAERVFGYKSSQNSRVLKYSRRDTISFLSLSGPAVCTIIKAVLEKNLSQ